MFPLKVTEQQQQAWKEFHEHKMVEGVLSNEIGAVKALIDIEFLETIDGDLHESLRAETLTSYLVAQSLAVRSTMLKLWQETAYEANLETLLKEGLKSVHETSVAFYRADQNKRDLREPSKEEKEARENAANEYSATLMRQLQNDKELAPLWLPIDRADIDAEFKQLEKKIDESRIIIGNIEASIGELKGYFSPRAIRAGESLETYYNFLNLQISLQEAQEEARKKTQSLSSSSSSSESVHRTVSNEALRGLAYQEIPGDGHCLFHAVGLYLGQDASHIRQNVAAHLEANTATYEPYDAQEDRDFSQHIADIREGREWGAHIEIEVIQRLKDRPIIIIRPDANPTIPDNLAQYKGSPIFVYYNGHTHYDAFTIQDGNDARTILATIQAQIAQGQRVTYNPDLAQPQLNEHSPSPSSSPNGSSDGLNAIIPIERLPVAAIPIVIPEPYYIEKLPVAAIPIVIPEPYYTALKKLKDADTVAELAALGFTNTNPKTGEIQPLVSQSIVDEEQEEEVALKVQRELRDAFLKINSKERYEQAHVKGLKVLNQGIRQMKSTTEARKGESSEETKKSLQKNFEQQEKEWRENFKQTTGAFKHCNEEIGRLETSILERKKTTKLAIFKDAFCYHHAITVSPDYVIPASTVNENNARAVAGGLLTEGCTLLEAAVKREFYPLAQWLLLYGADPTKENAEKGMALSILTKNRIMRIAELAQKVLEIKLAQAQENSMSNNGRQRAERYKALRESLESETLVITRASSSPASSSKDKELPRTLQTETDEAVKKIGQKLSADMGKIQKLTQSTTPALEALFIHGAWFFSRGEVLSVVAVEPKIKKLEVEWMTLRQQLNNTTVVGHDGNLVRSFQSAIKKCTEISGYDEDAEQLQGIKIKFYNVEGYGIHSDDARVNELLEQLVKRTAEVLDLSKKMRIKEAELAKVMVEHARESKETKAALERTEAALEKTDVAWRETQAAMKEMQEREKMKDVELQATRDELKTTRDELKNVREETRAETMAEVMTTVEARLAMFERQFASQPGQANQASSAPAATPQAQPSIPQLSVGVPGWGLAASMSSGSSSSTPANASSSTLGNVGQPIQEGGDGKLNLAANRN